MIIGAFLIVTVVFGLGVQSFLIAGTPLLVGTGTFAAGIAGMFYVGVSSVVVTLLALLAGIII